MNHWYQLEPEMGFRIKRGFNDGKHQPSIRAQQFQKWLREEPVYRLNAPNLCDNQTQLLIVINSRPQDLKTRQIIRETWASPIYEGKNLSIRAKLAFFWGYSESEPLNETRSENERYGDTISDITFEDSYKNVTYLAMARFKWINRYCGHVQVIYKVDTDVWVNLEHLLNEIESRLDRPGIHGHRYVKMAAYHDSKMKFYVSQEDYPLSHYPPYVCGCGYITINRQLNESVETPSIAERLISVAPQSPYFVWIDDVMITGLLRLSANIPLYNVDKINDYNLAKPVNACIYKDWISVHYTYPNEQRELHRQFLDPQFMNKCR